jgi:hypothetical protein
MWNVDTGGGREEQKWNRRFWQGNTTQHFDTQCAQARLSAAASPTPRASEMEDPIALQSRCRRPALNPNNTPSTTTTQTQTHTKQTQTNDSPGPSSFPHTAMGGRIVRTVNPWRVDPASTTSSERRVKPCGPARGLVELRRAEEPLATGCCWSHTPAPFPSSRRPARRQPSAPFTASAPTAPAARAIPMRPGRESWELPAAAAAAAVAAVADVASFTRPAMRVAGRAGGAT